MRAGNAFDLLQDRLEFPRERFSKAGIEAGMAMTVIALRLATCTNVEILPQFILTDTAVHVQVGQFRKANCTVVVVAPGVLFV